MLKLLQYLAGILTGGAALWSIAIKRKEELWQKYLNWRKGHREDKVDKVIVSRDSKSVGKLLRNILEKRHKRHKTS